MSIIKNNTNTVISLNDVSIILAPGELLDLSLISKSYEIYNSKDLKQKINENKIIINDGKNDLIIEEAIEYIAKSGMQNEYPITIPLGGEASGDYFWEFKKETNFICRLFYFGAYENPKFMKIIGDVEDEEEIATISLYDITHDCLISEITFNNTSPTILSSTLENIPSEESIFEIRGKVSKNNTKARLYYFSLI